MGIEDTLSTGATRGSQEGEGGGGIGAAMGALQTGTQAAGSAMGALTGALGFTGGLPASRHFDLTIGVDVHPFPPLAGAPIPAPYIGIVFDPFEYLSTLADAISAVGGGGVAVDVLRALGGSVLVNGRHKTMAGSMSVNIPHIPWVALNQGEVFMGSSTVLVEGEPFTYAALPTLTCWIAGILAPFRSPKPKKTVSPMLPTTFVIPLPSGRPVIVGGPPTISFMSLAFAAAFKVLGKVFKVLGKAFKAISKKLKNSRWSCVKCLLGSVVRFLGNPVDAATGKSLKIEDDFNIDATLPIEFSRVNYGNAKGGSLLGENWFDPWSEHLRFNNGRIDFYTANARVISFDDPYMAGTEATNIHAPQNRLRREGRDYIIWNNNHGVHKRFSHFPDGIYRLTKIEDQNRNAILFHYQKPTRTCPKYTLSHVSHTDGIELSVKTDTKGRILSVGRVVSAENILELISYTYDEQGFLSEVLKPNGYVERYIYSKDGSLLSVNYNDKYATKYIYDETARITAIKSTTQYYNDHIAYDPAARQTVHIDALSRKHTYDFDARDMPVREIDPAGNVTVREWGIMDDLLSVTDPLGRKVSFEYDEWGQITSVTYPDETTESFARDEKSRLTKYTDTAGRSWSFEYDARDNLLTETWPDGRIQRYERRSTGQVNKIIHSNGTETTFQYNKSNKLVKITEWNDAVTCFEYNQSGKLTSRIDAEGSKTQFHYDKGGNVRKVILADGREITAAYDEFGNKTSVTDAEGRTSRYSYGPYDTLEEMTDPMGHKVRFELDRVMRLKRVFNEAGETYKFEYDPADNLIQEIDFSGRVLRYTYDNAGGLIQSVAGDGRVTDFERDIMGRITRQTIQPNSAADSSEITDYTFAKSGELLEARRKDLAVSFTHDPMGQVLEEKLTLFDPTTGKPMREDQIAHAYDTEGNRVRRHFNGNNTDYNYDADGLITSFAHGGHTGLTIQRDYLGREYMRHAATGFTLANQFDKVGQLTAQAAGHYSGDLPDISYADQDQYGFHNLPAERARPASLPGAKWGVERKYRYDKAFNPTEIIDSNWGTTRYDYDARDQVTRAAHHNKTGQIREERFTYDPTRNIAASSDVLGRFDGARRAVEAARKYSPGGRIERRGDTTFAYDAQGRLVSKRVDRKGFRPKHWKYGWDGSDQLIRLETPDGAVWRYDYDPFGRRISKHCVKGGSGKAPGQVAFLWDGNLLSGERRMYADGTESFIEYHYEPGTFVPMAQVVDGVLSYIVTDQVGTPREMFSETGELVWARRQKLWGADEGYLNLEAANDNAGHQTCFLRFQGQIEDEESGLYYNFNRYYDADGNYISPDPICILGGFRLNSYVPNPLIWCDPLGLSYTKVEGGVNVHYPSKPHTNKTAGHWEAMLDIKDEMVESGNYKDVYLNLGLGREVPGIKPNRRPDVYGARLDGVIDQFEVPSKTDSVPDLRKRMKDNAANIKSKGRKPGKAKIRRPKKC